MEFQESPARCLPYRAGARGQDGAAPSRGRAAEGQDFRVPTLHILATGLLRKPTVRKKGVASSHPQPGAVIFPPLHTVGGLFAPPHFRKKVSRREILAAGRPPAAPCPPAVPAGHH